MYNADEIVAIDVGVAAVDIDGTVDIVEVVEGDEVVALACLQFATGCAAGVVESDGIAYGCE